MRNSRQMKWAFMSRWLTLTGAIALWMPAITLAQTTATGPRVLYPGCYICLEQDGAFACAGVGVPLPPGSSSDGETGTHCRVNWDGCHLEAACPAWTWAYPPIGVEMGHDLIFEIAAAHPRVAATLVRVTETDQTHAQNTIYWHNDAVTVDDVALLLQGQPMELEANGAPVIYEATIDLIDDPPAAVLTIVPSQPSTLDPAFTHFSLLLEPAPGGGAYQPVFWELQ